MSSLLPLSSAKQMSAPLSQHSRFLQRLHRRYSDLFDLLGSEKPCKSSFASALAALEAQGYSIGEALRILRQLVMARLMARDCDQQAPLSEVTSAMTELAEFVLDEAHTHARRHLDSLHGIPLDEHGEMVDIWIVGMGKLGARELNVSSDIDLIYVYEADGNTQGLINGVGMISNHEYFARFVKLMYSLIGDTTEHGCVFRVDLALRPNGNSGPPCVSLAALEEYLQTQGREWERFAWLKSRVVAPHKAITSTSVQALRGIVLPFVFRKYLDYNVFDALRVLHGQIRAHAARRSAGRPERANDVKLSRGGIREIEFTVQLLQVVRGGQFPELRCRPTLEALMRLMRSDLISEETAAKLSDAYAFLRRVEHRIQYLDDQQTHVLPTQDEDLIWVGKTMGFSDCCSFLHQLDSHREIVAHEFDALLGGSAQPPCTKGSCNGSKNNQQLLPIDFDSLLSQLTGKIATRISDWKSNPKILQLPDSTRARLLRIIQRTSVWLLEGRTDEESCLRLINWLEPLLRRESYLALLLERPYVHEQVLNLLGSAKWSARYLQQHPGVIDELVSDALLRERFVPANFERDLQLRMNSLQSTGEDHEENLMDLLRRAHHAEVFRTLARDIAGCITVEQVADDISALADCILRITVRWCWARFKNKHRETPEIAIIGYGKLGGRELSYGSDLDLVFVFDDDDDSAPEIYSAFARKLIQWLTVKTGEGDLFEIDTALRPNGSAGLLVTRFEAYANYQERRGSNTAWTWEHQAMTRARFILGSDDLGDPLSIGAPLPHPSSLRQKFDLVRTAVMTATRDPQSLLAEIVGMRKRVLDAHPVPKHLFDLKYSPGGMVDVEFAVQYLVLLHAVRHPDLLINTGNINLLHRIENVGLIPAGVGIAAANAYRKLRRAQHKARLDETSTQIDLGVLASERDAVLTLWSIVFKPA
jgi:[glutamine synthetase] adenylyltransferase / [glutamine synthetase]-adenylyl-L-tyrosine phosphorylase